MPDHVRCPLEVDGEEDPLLRARRLGGCSAVTTAQRMGQRNEVEKGKQQERLADLRREAVYRMWIQCDHVWKLQEPPWQRQHPDLMPSLPLKLVAGEDHREAGPAGSGGDGQQPLPASP